NCCNQQLERRPIVERSPCAWIGASERAQDGPNALARVAGTKARRREELCGHARTIVRHAETSTPLRSWQAKELRRVASGTGRDAAGDGTTAAGQCRLLRSPDVRRALWHCVRRRSRRHAVAAG